MTVDTFQEFCGGPIFNSTLLLDDSNTWPQFTECFQDSLLVWVPCGWVWLLLPFYIIYLIRCHDGVRIPVNILNALKSFFCILLAVLSAIELIRSGSKEDGDKKVNNVVYISAGIKAATFIVVCCLIQAERVKGIITSGVLWIFWLLLALAGIIPFYTHIMLKQYEKTLFQFVMFYIYYALVLTELVLHCFAERLGLHGYSLIGEKQSPELSASFPSRLIFQWINSLVFHAYRKGLEENNMWDLHPRDKSSRVVPEFQSAWEKELRRANFLNK